MVTENPEGTISQLIATSVLEVGDQIDWLYNEHPEFIFAQTGNQLYYKGSGIDQSGRYLLSTDVETSEGMVTYCNLFVMREDLTGNIMTLSVQLSKREGTHQEYQRNVAEILAGANEAHTPVEILTTYTATLNNFPITNNGQTARAFDTAWEEMQNLPTAEMLLIEDPQFDAKTDWPSYLREIACMQYDRTEIAGTLTAKNEAGRTRLDSVCTTLAPQDIIELITLSKQHINDLNRARLG